ncbi:MAG: phosphotransferase family protein [Myxococcota bacterium]|nr:phosphotransferase family protein [Myxococcota bacterium]
MAKSERDRAALPEEWQRAFDWVEKTVGGRLVRWESQPRWRPAWFLDVERDGETVPLYWRGARREWGSDTSALDLERRVMEVFEKHDIRVPHPYGLCDDPPGLLMERVAGIPPNRDAAESEAAWRAVMDDYLEQLARVHAIDPAEFEAAGFERPQSAERRGLGETPFFERGYREAKRAPDPLCEFLLRWVHRNVPKGREQTAFVVCDSGQFLWEKTRVTALHDFELAYIGDPAADLAGLRARDLSEPLGDIPRHLRKYAELTGAEPDLRAIDYHTIRFALTTPLTLAHLCVDPTPQANFVQYLVWYVVYARCPLEVLAHMQGFELDPPDLPGPAPSRRAAGYGHLGTLLDPAQAGGDAERAYELDRAHRVVQYLERVDAYGDALEADDLDDAGRVLGHRPATWAQADAELEAFVLKAGPESDAELTRLFHRRLSREEFLLRPTLRELEGAVMPPLD